MLKLKDRTGIVKKVRLTEKKRCKRSSLDDCIYSPVPIVPLAAS